LEGEAENAPDGDERREASRSLRTLGAERSGAVVATESVPSPIRRLAPIGLTILARLACVLARARTEVLPLAA
jgi:hypothetical protein